MPPSAVRLLASRVVKHGRQVFEGFIQAGKTAPRGQEFRQGLIRSVAESQVRNPSWLGHRLGLRPYLGPLAAEIRHRTCQNFMGGTANIVSRGAVGSRWYNTSGRLSLYAFLGISLSGGLSSGSDADLERGYDSVCANIRSIFSQKQNEYCQKKAFTTCDQLDHMEFGPRIAIGCNSAVYSARLQCRDDESDICIIDEKTEDASESNDDDLASECDYTAYDSLDSEDSMSIADSDITIITQTSEENDINHQFTLQGGHQAIYPLAVKMLFNYNASSNATEIYRQMASELVPMTAPEGTNNMLTWQNGNHVKKKRMPPHPNIIKVHDAFVQEVPQLPDALLEYPMALPQRLNPDGYGRNKTLFLVMDRYRWTLRQYLACHSLSFQQSLHLLAQLTEALVHMNTHQVAHRDLKSDNIVLEETSDGCHLVVTDFGSCLADERYGLRVPYHFDGLCKGGNSYLMAPEIATAEPGCDSYLDYRKSDLWAVGAIAYEIFGDPNPFYQLDSRKYDNCDIPNVQGVPDLVNGLIKSMLARDPEERPDPAVIATCFQLLLWLPCHWLSEISLGGIGPHKVMLMRWLTTFTAATLCHGQELGDTIEMQLRRTLLSRVHYADIKQSFELLGSVCA